MTDETLKLVKNAVDVYGSVGTKARSRVVWLDLFGPENDVGEGAKRLDLRKHHPLCLAHGLFIDRTHVQVNEIRHNIFHLTGSHLRVYSIS